MTQSQALARIIELYRLKLTEDDFRHGVRQVLSVLHAEAYREGMETEARAWMEG